MPLVRVLTAAILALLVTVARAEPTDSPVDWVALRAELLDRVTRGEEKSDDFSRFLEAWYRQLGQPIVINHPRENGAYFMPLVLASAPADQFPVIQQQFAADDLPNRHQVFQRAVVRFSADVSPLPFSREAWTQSSARGRDRYRLLKSFLQEHPPIGLSAAKIREHLGPPLFDSGSQLSYDLGEGPQMLGIDPMTVIFVLEADHVVSFHFQSG